MLVLLALTGEPSFATDPPDLLAESVARWQGKLDSETPSDPEAKEVRDGAAPRIGDAERALAARQRWVALSRMALVWTDLEAMEYRSSLPADLRGQMAELEREWARLGPSLAKIDRLSARPELAPLPAAARALGEAALAQMPVYYGASLDYGKNTAPEYGLFYLGAALAQRDLEQWISRLPPRAKGERELAPRNLSFEIRAATNELSASYVPPRSIDSHSVFIRISALLKEADELAAAGAHYGALIRLLDARARIARLLHPERSLSSAEAERRGRAVVAELEKSSIDTSLQQYFLETALFSAADPETRASGGGEVAAAIFDDVLPRFAALLGPAPKRPPDRKAEASVTIVRWPYT